MIAFILVLCVSFVKVSIEITCPYTGLLSDDPFTVKTALCVPPHGWKNVAPLRFYRSPERTNLTLQLCYGSYDVF